MASQQVQADQFDTAGRTLREATITVNVVGEHVYLHIEPFAGRGSRYSMKKTDWEKLKEATSVQ